MEHGSGQKFNGVVKSFNPAKGWGFIECEESKAIYGSDVFLLKGALGGACASPGDQVSFSASQGPKGVQANDVKILTPPEQQTFFGEIKTWNPQKGFGFITSPASEQIHGKDIFVLKSELGGAMVGPGAQLTFKAKTGERGPVAFEVKLLQPAAIGGAGCFVGGPQVVGGGFGGGAWGLGNPQVIGGFSRGAWGPASSPQYGGCGSFAFAPQSHVGGCGGAPQRTPSGNETFFGTLKNLNAEKGWGHIDCQATMKLYNKDIFVMRTALEGVMVEQGDAVAFNVVQGPKGPHASNLRVIQGAGSLMYNGIVKSFNDLKGWGFIECAQSHETYASDIFLHRKELPEGAALPVAGEQVRFTVDVSGGRAVAKGVQPSDQGSPARGSVGARASPY